MVQDSQRVVQRPRQPGQRRPRRFVPVGAASDNVGIVAFNVRRYFQNKLSYEMLVEVQNFGAAPANEKLTLYSGKEAIDVRTLTLTPVGLRWLDADQAGWFRA